MEKKQSFETEKSPCYRCQEWFGDSRSCISCTKVGDINSWRGEKDRREQYYGLTRKGFFKSKQREILERIRSKLIGLTIEDLEEVERRIIAMLQSEAPSINQK